jgi:hypothetical protein
MSNHPASIQAKQAIAQPICPNPSVWAKLHTAALTAVSDGDSFSKPLIVVGGTFSSDEEKRQSWLETVERLDARGLGCLIESEVKGVWYHG